MDASLVGRTFSFFGCAYTVSDSTFSWSGELWVRCNRVGGGEPMPLPVSMAQTAVAAFEDTYQPGQRP